MASDETGLSVTGLYDSLHERCPPGVWSKAVALARAGQVIEEARTSDEITLRIHVKDRPTSPKVSLWPLDEDCFCDCKDFGAGDDLCLHVAAAAIAIKNGLAEKRASEAPAAGAANSSAHVQAPYVRYRLSRTPEGLSLERVIVRDGRDEIFDGSLVGYVGGISSGRIPGPTLSASREDYLADAALSTRRRGVLERDLMFKFLTALRDTANVFLNGHPVKVGRELRCRAEVVDDGSGPNAGFRVVAGLPPGVSGEREDFRNGATLIGDVLHPSLELLPPEVAGEPRFAFREGARLVSEILPRIKKKIEVDVRTQRLPELRADARPRVVIKTERSGDGALAAVASLVYGDPVIAEVVSGQLELSSPREAPLRDEGVEWQLARKLQNELHLTLGRLTRLEGEAAAQFADASRSWEVIGGGAAALSIRAPLVARLEIGEGGQLAVDFMSADASVHAGWDAVARAWRSGQAYVPLMDGGFAPLPRDWLERYGERLERLLAARDSNGKLPACLLPESAQLCDELGQPYPKELKRLRDAIESFSGLPEASLPGDLNAELRHYQRRGIDWMRYLTGLGMGVLLADDMGLGKTLQALCLLDKGSCLIVCPTSVISAWMSQIKQFRPALKVHLYHGGDRSLALQSGVTLTTYSVLRLDRDALCSRQWDAVILDEAQTIKNPESQVAQAAHELRARIRIALSGTPVENRIDDLWSQFRFLNPGLLGTRRQFGEAFDRDPKAVRARLKPFMLRRLKREVAPELPPRTETVLHCELSEPERELYDALLATTRSEVVAQLKPGGSVLRALEALLRLRQACCHMGLVPGQGATPASSSASVGAPASTKVDLLVDSLLESIANGHRALVFSQWTSYLDLIEPALRAAGIEWCRLDGSSSAAQRAAVVEKFQRDDGPPVMLLSLKAGGIGLTLTAADHIFLMDPWWNPAVEAQAADRAHRIGQVNPVLIQRLIAKDTVEDRILLLQKKKLEIAGAVLHDAEGQIAQSQLTCEDLLELVS